VPTRNRGGNVDAAFRLFKSLVEQGIIPNTTNYNGLIGACSKNKKLVRESRRFALAVFPCSPPLCLFLNDWRSRICWQDLGLSTYAEMRARGLPPDFHTFNVLIELTTGCDRAELGTAFALLHFTLARGLALVLRI
jgi:pentatricopeptide repeat protein